MTEFDVIILVIVGIAAVGGYMRGLVQEALSLLAWVGTLFAIHNLHAPLTDFIMNFTDEPTSSSVLAFVLLLLIPYAAMKLIVSMLGAPDRGSFLGLVDRLLGFGFGIVKGVIIAILAFTILALGYDNVWGVSGRPVWIIDARSYPFINASADQLVIMISQQRKLEADANDKAAKTR